MKYLQTLTTPTTVANCPLFRSVISMLLMAIPKVKWVEPLNEYAVVLYPTLDNFQEPHNFKRV